MCDFQTTQTLKAPSGHSFPKLLVCTSCSLFTQTLAYHSSWLMTLLPPSRRKQANRSIFPQVPRTQFLSSSQITLSFLTPCSHKCSAPFCVRTHLLSTTKGSSGTLPFPLLCQSLSSLLPPSQLQDTTTLCFLFHWYPNRLLSTSPSSPRLPTEGVHEDCLLELSYFSASCHPLSSRFCINRFKYQIIADQERLSLFFNSALTSLIAFSIHRKFLEYMKTNDTCLVEESWRLMTQS